MKSAAHPVHPSLFNLRLWRVLAWIGVLLITSLLPRTWMAQNPPMTIAVLIFLLAALGIMAIPKLPSLLTLLLITVALVNGAGGAFEWFETYDWFDKVVHFYSGFSGLAAIGYLYACEKGIGRTRLTLWCAGMGLVLGIGWEMIEGLLGDLEFVDTLSDIVVDTLGAAAGGLLAWHAVRAMRNRRNDPPPLPRQLP